MRCNLFLGAVTAVMGLAFLSTSEPANARGCGGYVNQAIWGCAVWDNNPMCPYHPNCRRTQAAPPAVIRQGAVPSNGYRPAAPYGYTYDAYGRLVAQGAGNILTPAGSNRPRGY